ncbi:MAG: elongation factor 1-beta [Candidatus Altiarchaeia archaeon]|jgi:elongation factor 1-beta
MELNVAASIRIMPTGVEINLEAIKKSVEKIVSKYGKVNSSEIKPIAFGLKSLEMMLLLNDKTGGMDDIEAQIAKIDGVNGVEILEVTRL